MKITQKEIRSRICALKIYWIMYKHRVDTSNLCHLERGKL